MLGAWDTDIMWRYFTRDGPVILIFLSRNLQQICVPITVWPSWLIDRSHNERFLSVKPPQLTADVPVVPMPAAVSVAPPGGPAEVQPVVQPAGNPIGKSSTLSQYRFWFGIYCFRRMSQIR